MSVLQVNRYSRRLRFVAILIPALFILSEATFLIGVKWYYEEIAQPVLGVAILLVYGSVFWSYIHLIIVTTKPNISLKNKLLWSLITAIPILGFGVMLLFIKD